MNEKFNNERGEAKFIIENFEFIVRLASARIRKQNKNFKSLTLLIYNLSSLPRLPLWNLNNARFLCIIVNNARKTCCVAR